MSNQSCEKKGKATPQGTGSIDTKGESGTRMGGKGREKRLRPRR